MTYRVPLLVLVAAVLCAAGGCQLHPRPVDANGDSTATAPAPLLPYEVSTMRVQTVHGMAYLYTSMLTNFDDLSGPQVSRAIAALQQAAASASVRPTGNLLFVFHDPTEDPSAEFELEIGLPVPEKTQAMGDFKLRKLPPFRCASMVYRGPLKHLRRAYDKLIPEMITAGYIPSEQSRESYLVWEGAESSNNVVEVQVGIR